MNQPNNPDHDLNTPAQNDAPEAVETPQAQDNAPADNGASRLAELEAENARLKDHMLRALAESENIRKRALKEREDAGKFAISGFARDLLDVADNFRRALDAIPEDARTGETPLFKTLIDGIEAVERTLLRTFEKHGIHKLEPIGEPFDPNFHEVMFEAPMPGKAPGTVIQLIDPGYVLNDRLLRPARVGVAKSGGEGPESSNRHIDATV